MFRLMHLDPGKALLEESNGESRLGSDQRRARETHPFEPLDETIVGRQRHPLLVPGKQTLDGHQVATAQSGADQPSALLNSPGMDQIGLDALARSPN